MRDNNLNGLQFTCRSIFVNSEITNVMKHEAFWMVSQCSSDWLVEVGDSGQIVSEGCTNETRDLPPVSDANTGIVYKNQHCALCNRIEDTIPWESMIVCTRYLYNLLETTPISEVRVSLFQEQCRTCSYQRPSSVRPPRACYPTRNEMCRNCNGATPTCLETETFRDKNTVPRQCEPNIPPPTSDPPPTTDPPPTIAPPPKPILLPDRIIDSLRPLTIGTDLETRLVGGPEPINQGIPFTITLSSLGGGRVSVRTETESVNVTVDCPEGQAAVGLECRNTLCPESFVSVSGRCFAPQSAGPITGNNGSTNESGSGFFIDCPTELVPLNDTEFTFLSNTTVLVDKMVREVLGYKDGQPLICPDNIITVQINNTVFSYPVGFLELTYVGCSLSVIGSALVLITYGLFKELRSLPSKILMNLSFANLVTNLLILVGGPVTQAFPFIQLCTAVAILLHFFFLAQFTWMSVMSVEVVRKFNRAKKLIVDSKRDKMRLLVIYMFIGWGAPLLISTVSIVVNFTTTGLVLYGVLADRSIGSCWINHLESALIAFVAPLVLSISLNLVMFIIVTVYIFMAARSQSKLKKEDNTPFFHLNIAIFCTTGLTWVFGFIAILAGASWAWYLFIIFNSTQGFVIFVAFLLTKKTLKLYVNCLTCKRAEKGSSKSLTISTSQLQTNSSTVRIQTVPVAEAKRQNNPENRPCTEPSQNSP